MNSARKEAGRDHFNYIVYDPDFGWSVLLKCIVKIYILALFFVCINKKPHTNHIEG